MAGPQPSALGTGGAVTDLTAEDEAAAMVAAVRDDPARRLELAARFYDRRTGRASIRSYRRAELAFMHWQIRRGVLAAPGADRPGSPWWRAVNEGLLRDAWQARLLVSGQPGTREPAQCRALGLLPAPTLAAGVVPGPQCQHRRRVPGPPRPFPAGAPGRAILHGRRPHPGAVRALPAHRPRVWPWAGSLRSPGCSPIPAGAAPTCSSPCTTSCRTGIRSTGRPWKNSSTPRTTWGAWSITA